MLLPDNLAVDVVVRTEFLRQNVGRLFHIDDAFRLRSKNGGGQMVPSGGRQSTLGESGRVQQPTRLDPTTGIILKTATWACSIKHFGNSLTSVDFLVDHRYFAEPQGNLQFVQITTDGSPIKYFTLIEMPSESIRKTSSQAQTISTERRNDYRASETRHRVSFRFN